FNIKVIGKFTALCGPILQYIYCVHYIAESIGTPLLIIGFRCSNDIHGHLGMHNASTNICERMGRSQELSEFKCGTVIDCHLCNNSSMKFPCY
ncbi:unnamed protein product, partial [Staurois parvus]